MAVLDQADERAEVLGFDDTDRHLGVGVAEAAEQAGQRLHHQGRQRHQIQMAGTQSLDLGDSGVDGGQVAKDLAGGTDQRLARQGQGDPPAEPVEQLHPSSRSSVRMAWDSDGWATCAAAGRRLRLLVTAGRACPAGRQAIVHQFHGDRGPGPAGSSACRPASA